jgi:regulator of sigma E protease
LNLDSKRLQDAAVKVNRRKERAEPFWREKDEWMIGIGSHVSIEKGNPGLAIVKAVQQTYEYAKLTLVALYKMISGEVSPRNLGGPILIAQMAGQQAQEGIGSFLGFLAILHKPGGPEPLAIPVLEADICCFFVEAVIGRPVAVRHREGLTSGIFL